ncbi:multiple epidermal growth factor-like domains protein 10 isoform X6 [Haliotis rubra]|uniref:multiple epidermal growth factor-like domains protein 10 isoform X6 n=1 Tax=Haliotis rubra TaxID=36100 RepID=UPI001EE5490D|nr:multiple epidermal growth factor-like domains protein 10 isoform X6 [Haliotis rubra]
MIRKEHAHQESLVNLAFSPATVETPVTSRLEFVEEAVTPAGLEDVEELSERRHASSPTRLYNNSWSADKAVDGNRDQDVHHGSCFNAADKAWGLWTVDLGKQYRIHDVKIYQPSHLCSHGLFGVTCNEFCHCAEEPCDHVSGLCLGDCRPGWQGDRCDTECDANHYGVNCVNTCTDRKCSNVNSSCDRHSGSCDMGCLPGWIGSDCSQECTNGRYGQNCIDACSDRKCAGNSPCDHIRGACVSGCAPGWMGEDCRGVCDSQHYGANCDKACASRHCIGSSSCNSTGDCDSGCESGWTLNDCTGKAEEARVLQAAYNAVHLAVAVAAAFVVGVVVGAVVCFVFWWRRNRRPQKTSESPPTNASDARNDQSQNSDDVGPETRIYDSLHAESPHDAKITGETYCTIKSGNTDSKAHAPTSRNLSESAGAQMYENIDNTSRKMDGAYSE